MFNEYVKFSQCCKTEVVYCRCGSFITGYFGIDKELGKECELHRTVRFLIGKC